MSTFESRNKSIHPKSLPSNVYLRIFWFASTIQAILVSKVLYTTTSASFEIRKALQSSRFFYSVRTPWGGGAAPSPPTPLQLFFNISIYPKSLCLPSNLLVCLDTIQAILVSKVLYTPAFLFQSYLATKSLIFAFISSLWCLFYFKAI